TYRRQPVVIQFVTKNPADVPETVLGQLGNRVQHALRAFTPRDQKAVKAAAQTFRQNPALDIASTITQLAVGEALISMLNEQGTPTIVERALIIPPGGQIGPITAAQRQAIIKASLVFGHYEQAIDRESAYEILKGRAAESPHQQGEPPMTVNEKQAEFQRRQAERPTGTRSAHEEPAFYMKMLTAFATTATRAIAGGLSRQLLRGVLGNILGGGGGRKKGD